MIPNSPLSRNPARPRVYLAGPDVFLREAREIARLKSELCARYGLEGVNPIDFELDLGGLAKREAALKIGRVNEDLIRSCDGVIANITPFRGPSADVGTAFEMGYAAGLGLIVCAYSNTSTPFFDRTVAYFENKVSRGEDGSARDDSGMSIEDWGLHDNLMLESSIATTGGCLAVRSVAPNEAFTSLAAFEECLLLISQKELFKKHQRGTSG